jgi:hypothetical protein
LATIYNSIATTSIAALFALSLGAGAQTQTADLPDSPGFVMQAATQAANMEVASSSNLSEPADARSATAPVSPIYPGSHPYYHRVVKPDMGPQPLSSGQKFGLAARASISGMSFGSNFISAGWSHLNNSRPHYGSDKAGFGERLGAAKLKQTGENFFSYAIWASAFHEDPHYYAMGPSHPISNRAVYAATRVFITRKDSGGSGVNWSKLLGLACSNALVNAYYPDTDRGFKPSVTAYGTNILTTAAITELDEFLPDVIHRVHHKNR